MKILVCGDRKWTRKSAIYTALYGMPKDTIIINGACKGADSLATEVAKELDFDCVEYPANWDKHGKAAGPIRNQEMIDKESPGLVIAFHPNLSQSKGTLDMCKRARKHNIPVVLITR